MFCLESPGVEFSQLQNPQAAIIPLQPATFPPEKPSAFSSPNFPLNPPPPQPFSLPTHSRLFPSRFPTKDTANPPSHPPQSQSRTHHPPTRHDQKNHEVGPNPTSSRLLRVSKRGRALERAQGYVAYRLSRRRQTRYKRNPTPGKHRHPGRPPCCVRSGTRR